MSRMPRASTNHWSIWLRLIVLAGRHVSACAVNTQRAQVLTIRTCISKRTRKRIGGGGARATR